MTLQALINTHKPATIQDCDALVKGNFFYRDVVRDPLYCDGIRIGYRYKLKARRWWRRSEIAYVCGI